MSNAKISLGDKVNGYFSLIVSRVLLKMSIDIVGNFIILAFKEVISSLLRVAKFVFIPNYKVGDICILEVII